MLLPAQRTYGQSQVPKLSLYLQSVPLSESLEDIQYSDIGFHTTLHQTVLVCSGHKVMGFTGAITHTHYSESAGQ